MNSGVTNNGLPQYTYAEHAQSSQYAKYGLITAGPLQGTAFDENGNPFPFNYGSNGVPAKNAAGTVIGCYVGFCVGGDNSAAVGTGTSLQSAIERLTGFGRVGYSIGDDNEIYATANWARVEIEQHAEPGRGEERLTLSCSNPYRARGHQGGVREQGRDDVPVRAR